MSCAKGLPRAGGVAETSFQADRRAGGYLTVLSVGAMSFGVGGGGASVLNPARRAIRVPGSGDGAATCRDVTSATYRRPSLERETRCFH